MMTSERIRHEVLSEVDRKDRLLADLATDRSVGFLLKGTYNAVADSLRRRIARYGVTIRMWTPLRILWEEDGLGQGELSRRVGVNDPSINATITELERHGLVRRARNADDKRKVNVFLTQKGHDLEAELLALGREVNVISLKRFTSAEIELMVAFLDRIRAELADDDFH